MCQRHSLILNAQFLTASVWFLFIHVLRFHPHRHLTHISRYRYLSEKNRQVCYCLQLSLIPLDCFLCPLQFTSTVSATSQHSHMKNLRFEFLLILSEVWETHWFCKKWFYGWESSRDSSSFHLLAFSLYLLWSLETRKITARHNLSSWKHPC